ncbi:DIP1281 family NlpC/P60 protein [Corynebacterium sp. S7]
MAYTNAPVRRLRAKTWLAVVASSTSLSLVTLSSPALAQEQGASVSDLVSEISSAQSEIDQLNLSIGDLRESVNQAIVDLGDARSAAEQAQLGAEEARRQLTDSQEAVAEAQNELNELSRSTYRAAGTASPASQAPSADAQKDALERSAYLQRDKQDKQDTLTGLEHQRTVDANNESLLRQASQLASDRADEATAAEAHAQELLAQNQETLKSTLEQRSEAQGQLQQAQAELETVRPGSAGTPDHTPAPQVPAPDALSETVQDSTGDTASTPTESPSTKVEVSEQTVSTISEQAVEQATQSAPDLEISQPSTDRVSEAVNSIEMSAGSFNESNSEDLAAAAGLVAAALIVVASQGENDFSTLTPSVTSAAETSAASSAPATSAPATTSTTATSAPTATTSPTTSTTTSAEATPTTTQAAPSTTHSATPTTDSSTSDTGSHTTGTIPPTAGQIGSGESGLEAVLPKVPTTQDVSDQAQQLTKNSSREAQIETVIARAESQLGTSYAWGGGNANGPTLGIRDGGVADSYGDYNRVGFDCSGLTLYAFSGAGISLPHYTGYQYQRGTKVSPSQAQRGDLLFWGPQGNSHVAIYLGDGMMIEAPQSGSVVKKSPVRWSGMSEYAVRLI